MSEEAASDWTRALRALSALMVDPVGLGGIVLRARPGPVLQCFESALERLPLPQHRIHPGVDDTQLFGGLNVAASLSAGHLIRDTGLAELPCALLLPMAERTPPSLAARLAQLLDTGPGHTLVLLDEGADTDEAAPSGLADRLAFFADLSLIRAAEAKVRLPAPADLDTARQLLPSVQTPSEHFDQLVVLAARFGIDSQRAPLFALRCARALAALDGITDTNDAHLREAAELVFASRATQVPETEPDDAPPDNAPDPEPEDGSNAETDPAQDQLPDEILVQAVAACLPADLLQRLESGRIRSTSAQGSGAGAKKKGNRRGRPLPSRPGRLDGRARIDVVATLRAAAPWQPMRRKSRPDGPQLIIHPSDIRLRRFEDHSDRLVIFAVDASGSAAMARMAEAKGAIELLLGQAYAKRDQVALVAFRGTGAEILLPPTRSLVQAKRRLSALPGGGGTPLATGLRTAFELAVSSGRSGLSPSLAVLTDGRGNIAFDGSSGRVQAKSDARAMARLLRGLGMPTVVIDTSIRPGADSAELASSLGGHYLPLPRADAKRISAAADAALTR
ncbi:magnesium chelatase subunit D [Primorskyibacter sp. 2E233]|uniref:magnesium chelatase subunit D n=1 Tax=Primorskyibacter sp. 2E233 TaxID=3413431 RepID=UPI003BEFCE57